MLHAYIMIYPYQLNDPVIVHSSLIIAYGYLFFNLCFSIPYCVWCNCEGPMGGCLPSPLRNPNEKGK